LQVRSNKISGSQIELTVEIPREIWENSLRNKYEYYRKTVKIDGFRQGKVNMGMLKKLYGDSIEAEASDEMVKAYYIKALDQEKIDPIAPGDIKDMDYSEGKPFSFRIIVDVMPEIEVQALDSLETYLEEVIVEEEDIETGLNMLREDHAVLTSSESAIDHHSVVTADVQEVDKVGVPVLTHNWKDIKIEIGKNAFGPELDEKLLDKNAGDEVIAAFKTDGSGLDESKEVFYHFEIKEVNHKELPELDDEFAKSVNAEFNNVDDLRQGVKSIMSQQSNSRAKVKMLNRLVQHLIENNRIDVPPTMLDNYLERLLENARRDREPINEEDFRKKYEPSAIRNLKWYILRKNLIKEYNLHSSEEEVEALIEKAITESSADKETLRNHFKIEKNREKIVDDIEEQKVLDFIRSQAKIIPRQVIYRDFIANNP